MKISKCPICLSELVEVSENHYICSKFESIYSSHYSVFEKDQSVSESFYLDKNSGYIALVFFNSGLKNSLNISYSGQYIKPLMLKESVSIRNQITSMEKLEKIINQLELLI
jgi:hypothetical protein